MQRLHGVSVKPLTASGDTGAQGEVTTTSARELLDTQGDTSTTSAFEFHDIAKACPLLVSQAIQRDSFGPEWNGILNSHFSRLRDADDSETAPDGEATDS